VIRPLVSRTRRRHGPVLPLVILGLAACSGLTDVDYPDVVQPDQLQNATGAAALFAGAQHLFGAAFNGSTGSGSSFVYNTALMSDELRGASGGVITLAFDTRDLSPATTTVGDVFAALSRARVSALSAVYTLRATAPTPASRISQAYSLAAYSELFIAEMYCSGAPLTDVVDGLPATYSAPFTTQQLFQRAAADFDSALAAAGTDATSRNLAAVGKGRALLELGQFDAAATAVAGVLTTFSYTAGYSTTLLPNLVGLLSTNRNATVGDLEGTNGLNFRSANDPRIPVTAAGRGPDGATDVFVLTNVNTASPTVVANGIEARLIEAEAALRRGDAGWLTTLNALRATATPSLPALADPGSVAARTDLVFLERAFWLFATGHRLADLRRLIRQYGRATTATIPTGTYGSGRTYVNEVTASLPVQESIRNPNFTGCIDRNP
jgi:hypothetical protein